MNALSGPLPVVNAALTPAGAVADAPSGDQPREEAVDFLTLLQALIVLPTQTPLAAEPLPVEPSAPTSTEQDTAEDEEMTAAVMLVASTLTRLPEATVAEATPSVAPFASGEVGLPTPGGLGREGPSKAVSQLTGDLQSQADAVSTPPIAEQAALTLPVGPEAGAAPVSVVPIITPVSGHDVEPRSPSAPVPAASEGRPSPGDLPRTEPPRQPAPARATTVTVPTRIETAVPRQAVPLESPPLPQAQRSSSAADFLAREPVLLGAPAREPHSPSSAERPEVVARFVTAPPLAPHQEASGAPGKVAPSPAPAAEVPLVEQVAEGLVRHARVVERGESAEFTIELHPRHLGRVRVELSSSAEGLTARLVVSDESVRQVVASQLHLLEQRLADVSFAVVSTSVDDSGGRAQQEQQQREFWRQPQAEQAPSLRPVAYSPLGGRGQGLDVLA